MIIGPEELERRKNKLAHEWDVDGDKQRSKRTLKQHKFFVFQFVLL